jgi:hypothetical protein
LTTGPVPPPRRRGATLSPPADQPAEAQEFRHFLRTAVHRELALKARNFSLTPGFLCGCSLGPFGTHAVSCNGIKSLRICRRRQGLTFLLGGREQVANLPRCLNFRLPSNPMASRRSSVSSATRPRSRRCHLPPAGPPGSPRLRSQGAAGNGAAQMGCSISVYRLVAKTTAVGPFGQIDAQAPLRLAVGGIPRVGFIRQQLLARRGNACWRRPRSRSGAKPDLFGYATRPAFCFCPA